MNLSLLSVAEYLLSTPGIPPLILLLGRFCELYCIMFRVCIALCMLTNWLSISPNITPKGYKSLCLLLGLECGELSSITATKFVGCLPVQLAWPVSVDLVTDPHRCLSSEMFCRAKTARVGWGKCNKINFMNIISCSIAHANIVNMHAPYVDGSEIIEVKVFLILQKNLKMNFQGYVFYLLR